MLRKPLSFFAAGSAKWSGAGVPADIRSWFSGASGPATPDAGPRVLYPFDNSLTAPNVNRMQVDWKGTQTYYRVLLLGAKNSLRAFITCQATCSFAVPDNLWREPRMYQGASAKRFQKPPPTTNGSRRHRNNAAPAPVSTQVSACTIQTTSPRASLAPRLICPPRPRGDVTTRHPRLSAKA